MLVFLQRKVTDRKLRLFAAACCRRGRSLLRSRTALAALEALEAYADGLITRTVMEEQRTAWYGRFDYPFPIGGTWNSALAKATITHTKVWAAEAAEQAARASNKPDKEQALQARLLRDLIGNPFRPLAVEPSWLAWNDGTAVKMAQRIYNEHAFEHLPVLADALEEAGCHDADILAHCRQPGQHVRGCWVVDLLTGRS
jgi:hypothetical protein